jgi:tRNA (cytidine/uridine-2'-O-)-methyltransferase
MRLCLYQPEIPQNAGTLLRMAACLGLGVDIIEPCGFGISDRRLQRAGMDYLDQVDLKIHVSWEDYLATKPCRLILLDTGATQSYTDFSFEPTDTLMVGQESIGVPDGVKQAVHGQVRIPMLPGLRSFNVAISAAMVVGEAYRQTGLFPKVS